MRPQVIIITHTDWKEPDPAWVRQPLLPFRRDDPEAWKKVFYDLGTIARVDSVAIGCRGTFDPEAVACLPIARAAHRTAAHQPTATFWADTVGLPDISYNLGGQPFDCANPLHRKWAIEHFFKHFFDHWKDANLTRTSDGRLILPWWGIHSTTGHGFINQHAAQLLLDDVSAYVAWLGLGGVAHIVDKEWMNYGQNAQTLRVWGVHNWFSWQNNPPIAHTTRTHNGVTVGVVVPSYSDPNQRPLEQIQSHGGATARAGLAACAGCDVVILEGATGFVEGIDWIRDSNRDTSKLDAIRAFVGVPVPEPTPVPGGLMHLAISTEPILKWTTGLLVQSQLAPNRYALRWTQDKNSSDPKVKAGFPDATSKNFMCLNPDGTTEAKGPTVDNPDWQPGEWESSQPVADGDVEVRWFTVDAAGAPSACVVYGLQRKVA